MYVLIPLYYIYTRCYTYHYVVCFCYAMRRRIVYFLLLAVIMFVVVVGMCCMVCTFARHMYDCVCL